MATTTTNFGWDIPQSTDLVKDGATAIAALGQDIDTAFVDLKGGTTGQVLAKASNTDLDYSWVAQDDSNAIQNAIVDAKGDLIAATAADTPARLAVGNNGETLVADSSTSTGLRYRADFAAGKNKIINGDFGIWQRGTTFTNPLPTAYTADRWQIEHDGTGATRTVSQQTFTPGAAPVAGYEGQYFYRYAVTAIGTGNTYQDFRYNQEDVRTLAGQTATISFWAKADASRVLNLLYRTVYGTGGSSANQFSAGSVTLTTSWVRYSITYAVPSVSGLTIGAGSYAAWIFRPIAATAQTIDIWGVQVEAGSVATAFQTSTGTIQGELAACQRYFEKSYDTNVSPGTASQAAGINMATGATSVANNTTYMTPVFRVDKRTTPTVTCYSYAGTSGVASKVSDGLDLSANTATAKNIGFTGFWVYNNNASTFTTTQGAMFQWTASAEL